MRSLILAGRLVFGAWMLANGVNHFLVSLYPEPAGHESLAMLLMTALVHSRLFDVAMTIELVSGALILAGAFVPLALCVVMPVSVCALYWALILEHRPLGVALGLAAFALNGLLMLAYVDYYRGMLQRHAVTLGESEGGDLAYEAFFANPAGRTSRAGFLGALVPLVAAAALYFFLVKGRNGEWVLATLLFPATILHVRRLHDMGQSAWLLLVPTVLNVTAIWLHMFNRSPEFRPTITVAALVVSAAFLLWASLGRGASQPNRFGAPAAA